MLFHNETFCLLEACNCSSFTKFWSCGLFISGSFIGKVPPFLLFLQNFILRLYWNRGGPLA
jgi:hypothetical protein